MYDPSVPTRETKQFQSTSTVHNHIKLVHKRSIHRFKDGEDNDLLDVAKNSEIKDRGRLEEEIKRRD